MDLVCTRCGEPWSIDHVLHEEPESFERKGGVIFRCPSCPKYVYHNDRQRHRLKLIRELGELCGNDIDGFAATLEDLGLL